MDCRIAEESPDRLMEYASVSIPCEVRSIFAVDGDDPRSAKLVEKCIDPPWTKNYDSVQEERPLSWPKRWDISNWGIFAAYAESQRIGGCVIAYDTAGVHKLEGRNDLAVLWDLRVDPGWRGKQIGAKLFEHALQWARNGQCRELKVETQNINVPACRFYERQGCRLVSINRYAYPALPEEVELMWGMKL